MVYPAKVIGPWKRGKQSACAVELELPGGILGNIFLVANYRCDMFYINYKVDVANGSYYRN